MRFQACRYVYFSKTDSCLNLLKNIAILADNGVAQQLDRGSETICKNGRPYQVGRLSSITDLLRLLLNTD